VVDCPDPRGLAAFWSAVLGQDVTGDHDDVVVVARSDRHSGLASQRAPDHRSPERGDRARPQQRHLDVMVDDVLVPRPGWAPPVGEGRA